MSLSVSTHRPVTTGIRTSGQLLYDAAYVDGRWIKGDAPAIPVHDPSTGALIGTVPGLGVAETRQAIEAAHAAMTGWSGLLPQERSLYLRKWYDLILANKDDLARLITAEQGKPLHEARGEIAYAASFVEWFAEEAKRIDGEMPMSHLPSRQMTVRRSPVGVVACVTPWNFPSAMITRKAAAAMAAGCAVVVRPASETPLSALALAGLCERAGVPAGVFNVVTGDAATIVEELCTHKLVRAVSFTGSTAIGKKLVAMGSSTMKRMSMELGGHAPFMVFPDADLDTAVASAIDAKFQTTGQDCLAANRIYVHTEVYDEFVERFTGATRKLRVGDGFEPGIDVGPLMHRRAIDKCLLQIADATAKGARLMCGGIADELFLTPAVLADVTPDMAIATEETFGPVAALMRFEDEDELIAAANDSDYGLSAYLYTNDYDRICRMGERIRVGMLAVNCVKMTGYPIPFGGVRESGLGREGGRLGMQEFLDLKYVCAAFRGTVAKA